MVFFAEAGYTTSSDQFEQQVVYPASVNGISCDQPGDSLADCVVLDGPFMSANVKMTNPLGVQCECKLLKQAKALLSFNVFQFGCIHL